MVARELYCTERNFRHHKTNLSAYQPIALHIVKGLKNKSPCDISEALQFVFCHEMAAASVKKKGPNSHA